VIRHRLFGAAHLDRIGRASGPAALGQSNPGTMRETPGGAALNVASSLAALGAPVTLCSAVGSDNAGALISEATTARGIEFLDLSKNSTRPTATYTAILDASGDLITALADMEIYDAIQVEQGAVSRGEWLHLDANLSEPTLAALLDEPAAHRSAMTVSVAKANRLRGHLSKLDVLFTNRAEAARLCEVPTDTGLADLAAELSAQGTRRAIITDGPRSIAVLDAGDLTETPVPTCEVTSVTGAGDALTAATLFALGKGQPLSAAVRLGIQAAQAILAVDGPYRADLAQAIGVSQ